MNGGSRPEGLDFCCPSCGSAVRRVCDAYHCDVCARAFPIRFGIPDFRLHSDGYLDLAAERDKAERLFRYSEDHSFRELVAKYYAITSDVPEALARVYSTYVESAPLRGRQILDEIPSSGRLLDLGCGSGGTVLAAKMAGRQVVGVDIALRWLVIAKRRLAEAGVEAELVCACAEALPFPAAQFDAVIAADLLENTQSPTLTLQQAARQLRPGGTLWLSSNNSHWIGPHAASRVWAAGFISKTLRARILRRSRGVDSLRHVSLISSLSVAQGCREAGLSLTSARPKLPPADLAARRDLLGIAARVYRRLYVLPAFRRLLFTFGPAFELVACKTQRGCSA